MDASSADLIIIDSISTFSSYDATNAGGMGQIRSIAEFAMIYAKRNKKSIVIIGHVTKDGSISGPKTLEHLVDTVLFLEGSKYENYRILRTLKNRFGPTDEIGLFRMTEKGLIDLPNPGLEFVENTVGVPGSAIGITIE
jgi:DNA repair protein RadA/Sms